MEVKLILSDWAETPGRQPGRSALQPSTRELIECKGSADGRSVNRRQGVAADSVPC